MNKKKLIVISGIVLSFLVVVVVIIMACSKDKITIFFDVDGGSKITRMKVNVGEKIKLPKTTKKGFSFEGWFIADKKISNKVSFNQDTTLTARWKKLDKQTMTISFDTDGGNKVKDMIITCDESFKLPKPRKEGYNFIDWEDKKGNVVTNKSKLACEDITLKAKWEKEEEKKEENKEEKKEETKVEEKKEVVKKEYTCSNGYTLDGDKCIKEEDVKTRCGEGTTEKDGKCVTITSDTRKELQKSCSNNGTLVGDDCFYNQVTEDSEKETCEGNSHVWDSQNNKCYTSKEVASQSCSNGYISIANPGNGIDGGCFPVTEKEKYCSDGFTLKDNKCIKIIDATLK